MRKITIFTFIYVALLTAIALFLSFLLGISNTVAFLVLFLIVIWPKAIASINTTLDERRRVRNIKQKGVKYTGIITGYTVDDSVLIYGKPLIALIVRTMDPDYNINEYIIPTGQTEHGEFLKGKAVDFLTVSSKEAVCIGLSDKVISPDVQKLLLNADVETNQVDERYKMVSCTCPNCGSTVMLSENEKDAHTCEYCGNTISLSDFPRAKDIYDVAVQGENRKKVQSEIPSVPLGYCFINPYERKPLFYISGIICSILVPFFPMSIPLFISLSLQCDPILFFICSLILSLLALGWCLHVYSELKSIINRIHKIKNKGVLMQGIIVKEPNEDNYYSSITVRFFDPKHYFSEVEKEKYEIYETKLKISPKDKDYCQKGVCIDFKVVPVELLTQLICISDNPISEKQKRELLDHPPMSNAVVRRDFVDCNCPKCSAKISIANHGTGRCSYCGALVSYDDFSKHNDMYDVGSIINNN